MNQSLNKTPNSFITSTSLSSSSSSSPSFYSDDGSDDYNDIEKDAIEKGRVKHRDWNIYSTQQ